MIFSVQALSLALRRNWRRLRDRYTGIADVRVRRGFRGKLILQARRHLYYCELGIEGWEPAGKPDKTDWYDVDGNDPEAVREAMTLLAKLSTPPLPLKNPHLLTAGDFNYAK